MKLRCDLHRVGRYDIASHNVADVRRDVQRVMHSWGIAPSVIDLATLVTADLASHIVRSGLDPIEVLARQVYNGVHVEVRSVDGGNNSDWTQSHGAKSLVGLLAADWGIDTEENHHAIWFHIEAESLKRSA